MKISKVLIVEDDPAARAHLVDAIEQADDLEFAGAADTVAGGRELLQLESIDVLLTDLGLPDGSGIDLIEHTATTYPHIEIAVMTVFADEAHVLSAIEKGATGYLLKDGNATDVAASVSQLVAGGSPISPSIARHVLRRLTPTAESPTPVPSARQVAAEVNPVAAVSDKCLLTHRETDVLQQIAKGFSYEEIALSLGISVHTVTTHIKNIYRKLAVRSRGEAVFEAMQLGLIRVDNQSRL